MSQVLFFRRQTSKDTCFHCHYYELNVYSWAEAEQFAQRSTFTDSKLKLVSLQVRNLFTGSCFVPLNPPHSYSQRKKVELELVMLPTSEAPSMGSPHFEAPPAALQYILSAYCTELNMAALWSVLHNLSPSQNINLDLTSSAKPHEYTVKTEPWIKHDQWGIEALDADWQHIMVRPCVTRL